MSQRSRAYYNRDALVGALRDVGVSAGETVLSHVGVGMLGYPEEGASEETAWAVIADAFRTVLGESGTWLVPTYSYTFTKPGEVYVSNETPSDVGPFTDYFRRLPGARRSADPIFSVAALGPRADELLAGLPRDCFGADSIYGRLTRAGAKLCNVGVGFRYATYVHHVEQSVGVPYRFSKYFTGIVRDGAGEHEETWHYYVRALEDPGSLPDLRRLEAEARRRGLVRAARVGLGELTCVSLPALYELAAECVGRDPWFMARGGAEEYSGERPDQRGRVEFSPEREPGRSDR